MDSREMFFKIIWTYYNEISDEKIPAELVIGLSDCITDYYYDQYNRFRIQYPKSAKRYSSFQIKDLNHPTTFEMIIKFFKNKLENNYLEYSKIILNMTDSELRTFENNRADFYNMY